MTIGAEQYDHQRIARRLEEIGWRALPDFSPHQRIEEYVRWDLLEDSVRFLNREMFAQLDSEEQKEVLKQVRGRIEEASSAEVLNLIKYGVSVEVRKGRSPVQYRLRLIDWDHWENNNFWYGYEARFPGMPRASEPDFTLFINGIPVVVIEVKRTRGAEEDTHRKALSQIAEYERRSPRLFAFVHIGVAFGTQQLYLPTWAPYEDNNSRRKPLQWRHFNPQDNKYEKEDDIFAMLTPATLLSILRNYTFVGREIRAREDGKYEKGRMYKVIPRYMQFYTVERAIHRIHTYLQDKDDKNRGLIWHWQGSGKSYEIYPFLTLQFMERFFPRNPHAFIVVDRRELEDQMWGKYIQAVDYNPPFPIALRRIENIRQLKEVLQKIEEQTNNPNLTHASVSLVLLHKFRYEDLKDINPILKREILILRDEVHRTEHGKLAEVLYSKFPKAIRFGFTGTPIIGTEVTRQNKGSTFEEFGYPQEGELYMDCFFISDSIKDGYTLPMIWREVRENEIRIPEREDLRKLVEETLLSDVDHDEGVLVVSEDDVTLSLRELLMTENRIIQAARYIADHVEEDTEGFLFKAFVVAENRYAAVLFHRYLTKALREKYEGQFREEWVQVVMTGQGRLVNPKWEVTINEFIQSETKKYGKNWDQLITERKQRFTEWGQEPRILIVSDMLLQGYDAPILKAMYIYKLMRGARLLQAIARTNRPAFNRTNDGAVSKVYGLIVDMTGMLFRVFRNVVERYHVFSDKNIEQDILKNIFQSVDQRWEKFLEEFRNVKHMLDAALDPIAFNYQKLKEKWNTMDEDAINTIVGYLTQRLVSPTILEIINDLHRVIRSFDAIGVYQHKEDYYEDHEFMIALLRALRSRFYGKKELEKYATIDYVKEKALRHIHFSPFETVRESTIDHQFLSGKVSQAVILRTEVAHLINIIHLELEEKSKRSPLYEILYERMQKIRDQFLAMGHETENLSALQDLKRDIADLNKEMEDTAKYVETTHIFQQIAQAVMSKHFRNLYITPQVRSKIMNSLIDVLESVAQTGMIQPTHKRQIKRKILTILPDTIQNALIIAADLIDTLEGMVNQYLLCGQDAKSGN